MIGNDFLVSFFLALDIHLSYNSNKKGDDIMPWMTSNSSEYNPNRNPMKDMLYIERGKRLIDPEKMDEWKKLIKVCSDQCLDRDVEFTLALDFLEILQAGIEVEEAISIFSDSVDREVEFHRISPAQGCIARDIVGTFGPFGLEFAAMIPEKSFLHLDTKYIQKK